VVQLLHIDCARMHDVEDVAEHQPRPQGLYFLGLREAGIVLVEPLVQPGEQLGLSRDFDSFLHYSNSIIILSSGVCNSKYTLT
jgi:hypothetical protein